MYRTFKLATLRKPRAIIFFKVFFYPFSKGISTLAIFEESYIVIRLE